MQNKYPDVIVGERLRRCRCEDWLRGGSKVNEGVLVFLAAPLVLLFPGFTYPEIPAALVTLCLMILALEPLIFGITGRSI